MVSITQILNKVFPKLRAIEENPALTVMRMSAESTSNPFSSGAGNEVYDNDQEVACIYSEQPEIITSSSNIVTQQQMYFYVQTSAMIAAYPDSDGEITMKDRFIFKNKRYRPVDIQELFGLWKVRVNKE